MQIGTNDVYGSLSASDDVERDIDNLLSRITWLSRDVEVDVRLVTIPKAGYTWQTTQQNERLSFNAWIACKPGAIDTRDSTCFGDDADTLGACYVGDAVHIGVAGQRELGERAWYAIATEK
jgi:hypothetical protein